MRACSSSRASCHPLMVTDPTLSVVFLATIFLLPSSLYRKGTAQINLSDAVETVQLVEKRLRTTLWASFEGFKPHLCSILDRLLGVLGLFWTTARLDNNFFNSLDRCCHSRVAPGRLSVSCLDICCSSFFLVTEQIHSEFLRNSSASGFI